MRTNYVLIDFENVHVKSLELIQGDHFRVVVFLGPKNTKLPVDLVLAMQRFGDRGEYVLLETAGTNALDFHLAFHLGRLATADPSAFFHIISKDTGFDPLVQHLKTRKVFSARSPSIEDMPCFTAAPAKPSPKSPETITDTLTQQPYATPSFENLWRQALEHLATTKASKPTKTKTLHSTIHARLGKELPASTIDVVCSELVKRGYVKVKNSAVTYALPLQPGNG